MEQISVYLQRRPCNNISFVVFYFQFVGGYPDILLVFVWWCRPVRAEKQCQTLAVQQCGCDTHLSPLQFHLVSGLVCDTCSQGYVGGFLPSHRAKSPLDGSSLPTKEISQQHVHQHAHGTACWRDQMVGPVDKLAMRLITRIKSRQSCMM